MPSISFSQVARTAQSRLRRQTPRDQAVLESSTDQAQPGRSSASTQDQIWEKFLEVPTDDETLRQKSTLLFTQLQQHVENFYTRFRAAITAEQAVQLEHFLGASSPELLPLLTSESPQTAIKHCLAYWVASSTIASSKSSHRSLLPLGWTFTPQLTGDERSSHAGTIARYQAYSRWRQLTTFLHPKPLADARFQRDSEAVLSKIVSGFHLAFEPFRTDQTQDDLAKHHLTTVLKNTVGLAILIFSQPSILQFSWDMRLAGDNSLSSTDLLLVVAPALIRVTDDNGLPLASYQVITTPVIEQLQGVPSF